MPSVQFLFRLAKTIPVIAIGLMALLIVIGNTTDYFTNYLFVEHVMKMDTTFPGNHLMYRSINNGFIFHAGYIILIIMEAAMAFGCLNGGRLLLTILIELHMSFIQVKTGPLPD
jgi:predicted small integral membrane protein